MPVKTIRLKTKAAAGIAHRDVIAMKTEAIAAIVNENKTMIGPPGLIAETTDRTIVTVAMIGQNIGTAEMTDRTIVTAGLIG